MSIDLRTRPPAYEVMRECLTQQAVARPRSRLARILGFRPVHRDAASWFSGALGELAVARQLARLGPEWTVLHSIPVGTRGSDIDHVLIGPGGVFTINTKRHAGQRVWVGTRTLMVAGQKTDHLRNSRSEAERAAKALSLATGTPVTVISVLALVATAGLTIRQRPEDVVVLTEHQLVGWLKRRKPVLGPAQVQILAEAAARPATWSTVAALPVEQAHGVAFGVLRAEHDRALMVRRMWTVVVLLVLVVTLINIVPVVLSAAFASLLH